MFKFYTKVFIFIIVFITTIKILDQLVIQDELTYITQDRFFDKNEKFDFVFMGNSLSQRSYNTDYIDNELNSKSINIGSAAQHFYITNAIFNDFVDDVNLHPQKLLIVTISPWQFKNFDDKTWKFLQMTSMDGIKYSKNYFEIINEFYDIDEFPRVLSPTIRFHSKFSDNIIETNKRLKHFRKINANGFLLNVESRLDQIQREEKKGLKKLAKEYSQEVNNSKEIKISDKGENIILNMIEKCAQNNINLLFVTPPAINMIYEKEDYGKMKYLKKLFKANKTSYINLNNHFHELGLEYDDYGDYSHLNKSGHRKITPFLLDYIKKEFKIVKNEKKKEGELNLKEENESNNDVIDKLEIVKSISSIENYRTIFTALKDGYKGESAYNLSRTSITESAFSSTTKIPVKLNSTYRLSIIIKKGKKGNLFGLRMQGVYPDRVDAVFDLEKGILKKVQTTKEFKNENATIEPLGDGWYKCSITAKVNSEFIKALLGPTTNKKYVVGWEGKTSEITDVLVVPSSLILEELIQ